MMLDLLRILRPLVACVVAGIVIAPLAPGAAVSADDPVESGRQTLQGKADFPWYDREKDALKRVDVRVVDKPDAANRASNWELDATPAAPATPPTWSFLETLGEIIKVLMYVLLFALLATLVALLVRAFLRREAASAVGTPRTEADDEEGEIDRVESLPFQVKRPRTDLLSEAQHHYAAGNFGEAIVYLFSYELVQLDKQQFLHLTRGKTNRQYLREIRAHAGLSAIVGRTMIAFEEVFFGRHPLDRQRFEECWNELEDFHRYLGQEVEVVV